MEVVNREQNRVIAYFFLKIFTVQLFLLVIPICSGWAQKLQKEDAYEALSTKTTKLEKLCEAKIARTKQEEKSFVKIILRDPQE